LIKGLTHNEEGDLNKVTIYKGKISTGYAPNEPPNSNNYPMACGFFRMLRETVKTERVGPKKIETITKKWVLNEVAQKALEKDLPKPNNTPRRIKIISLFKTPQEMWESSLSMYSNTDGLLCKSQGAGTVAKNLKFGSNGEREWVDRDCLYHGCPDFKGGKCKPMGMLKCFPAVDMATNPYRFETRSINTIIGIESALQDLWNLLRAAHSVKEMEAGKQLSFDGFFGMEMYLIHRKKKSGGRDVFVTELKPTEKFNDLVMEPIKRGLANNASKSQMIGGEGHVSMLESAGQKLLESNTETDPDGPVPLDDSDQQDIAVNFGADADEGVEVTKPDDFDTKEAPKKSEVSSDKGNEVASKLLD